MLAVVLTWTRSDTSGSLTILHQLPRFTHADSAIRFHVVDGDCIFVIIWSVSQLPAHASTSNNNSTMFRRFLNLACHPLNIDIGPWWPVHDGVVLLPRLGVRKLGQSDGYYHEFPWYQITYGDVRDSFMTQPQSKIIAMRPHDRVTKTLVWRCV